MSRLNSQPTSYDLRRLNSLEDFDNLIACLGVKERGELTSLRNNYAPINRRLPAEVLCEVFLRVAKADYEEYEVLRLFPRTYSRRNPKELPNPYAWLPVTHVCRHWRDIALNFPNLWTSIYHKKPDYVRTFLARSRHALLDVKGHHEDGKYVRQVIDDLLRERHRWRIFECTDPILEWDSIDGASQLKKLRLRNAFLTPSVEVPTASFFEFPHLRRVDLKHVSFSFVESLVTRNLITKLSLESVSLQSPAAWVDVLRSLPSLEELKLAYVFRTPSNPHPYPVSPSRRISFPRLRHLYLCEMDEGSAASTFLDMITIPSSTTLSLEGKIPSVSYEDLRHLLQTLGQGLTGDAAGIEPPREILACRVECSMIPFRNPALTVEVWTCPVSMDVLSFRESGSKPSISLRLTSGHPIDDDVCRTARLVFDSLPLSKLCLLHFSGFLSNVLEPQQRSKLHSVRELCVDYRLPSYVSAPGEQEAEFLCPPAAEGAPLPFPNLEHLCLRFLKWHKHPSDHSRPCSADDNIIYDVRGVLHRRKAAGLSLKTLNLRNGINIGEDEAKALVRDGLVGAVEECEGSRRAKCPTCGAD